MKKMINGETWHSDGEADLSTREASRTTPTLSILVPVYNNSQYLEECLESVLHQTLGRIEIIVIDDGSTDSRAIRIMDGYARRHACVKLIRKANSGYGHSLNVGLKAASGEYIGIVESDDYMEGNAYKSMYDLAKTHDLDFVLTDFERFFGDKKNRKFKHHQIYPDKNGYYKVLNSLHDDGRYFTILNVIWNAIYKRDFLMSHNIRFHESPGASFQDNGFSFQTYIHARRFMLADFSTYRLRRDNAESSFYCKDKAFAMLQEYRFLENLLASRPWLFQKFIGILYYRSFCNCLFVLNRVDAGHLEALAAAYAREFGRALEAGHIDKDIFGGDYDKFLKIVDGGAASLADCGKEVTIILTVYNKEKYLKATLDSLLNQSFRDYEMIIIDDGSIDDSSRIINEYALRDGRIKSFRQENRGPGPARNVGLQAARGEYVLILDADDLFKPDFVARMLNQVKKHTADFCVCESEGLDEQTGATKKIDHAVRWSVLPDKQCFSPAEISGNLFKAFVGWAWDKIYKRSFIEQHALRFPDLAYSEDLVFVFGALASASRIAILRNILVTHRYAVQNSVSNKRNEHPLEFMNALGLLKQTLRKEGRYEGYRRSFLSYVIHHYLWNLDTIQGKAALRIAASRNELINRFGLERDRSIFFDQYEYGRFFNMAERV